MATSRTTSDDAIAEKHAKLASTFRSGRTKSFEWRIAQLQALRKIYLEHAPEIIEAVAADLGRPKFEGLLAEVSSNIAEVDCLINNLKSWMKPERVTTPILQQPGRSVVVREPKGLVLIISPWNFPFNLSFGGMMSAIAAGNCLLLKPSEVSPRCEIVLQSLVERYLDPEAVAVVRGGPTECTALLKLRWDHIFYTGNGTVARIVARAAAENLTPCTLELGGKSPSMLLPGCNIPVAVRRLLSGKLTNAGQICIAPDYLLVHKDIEKEVANEIKATISAWHGKDASLSNSFGRIINQHHFKRIQGLVNGAGADEVIAFGEPDLNACFIPPTLLREPKRDSALMREEIFGPVLPILRMNSVSEMIDYVNSGEKPLALYIFGPEVAAAEIIAQTSSGGVCVNDTLFHCCNPYLPFGGIGESGVGKYHGKWGFDEFSHIRGVLYRKTMMDLSQRYPPYTDGNMKLFEKLIVGPLLPPPVRYALLAFGGIACSLFAMYAISKWKV